MNDSKQTQSTLTPQQDRPSGARASRFPISSRWLFVLANALSVACVVPAWAASIAGPGDGDDGCKVASHHCRDDSQCCDGLVCGDARSCQPGCRIDGVFYSSGMPNPRNACQSCNPSTSTREWSDAGSGEACDMWVTNGPVYATTLSGNTLYVGGYFTRISPPTGGGVPVDANTGSPIPGFPQVAGFVYAVAPDGAGGWYIGGEFSSVGAVPRRNLAQILSDGSVSAWDPSPDFGILSIAVSQKAIARGNPYRPDEASEDPLRPATIYVGGYFSSIGGQPRSRLAAIDALTGQATAWDPHPRDSFGDDGNAIVRSLAVTGGVVYVGGEFASIGAQARNGLAAIDATTGNATAWDPNMRFFHDGFDDSASVRALAVHGGVVYAGGVFNSVSGQSRNGLAAIDASSGHATAWDPNPQAGIVYALALNDGLIYVGGNFSSIGGQPRNGLAAIDLTSGNATRWDANPTGPFASANALAVNRGVVYVSGGFSSIGGQPRNGLAAIDAATGLATRWDPDPNGGNVALAANRDSVYVGGSFTGLGGLARLNLAAIDVTTGKPTAWDPELEAHCSPIYSVTGLVVSGDTVYAAGCFRTVGGQPHPNLAAIDATTGVARAWPVSYVSGIATAVQSNGSTVYVGGLLEFIVGQPVPPPIPTRHYGLAAISVATGLTADWTPDPLNVNALAPGDGVVYAATSGMIGGQLRSGLAAIDLASGLATSWDPNLTVPEYNGPPSVTTLAVNSGTVYAGGFFTHVGGQLRNGVAAIDATTGLAASWDPNTRFVVDALDQPGQVQVLAVGDGVIYAGGPFTEIGGRPRSHLAALDAVTGEATDWNPNPGTGSFFWGAEVYSVTVGEGRVYVGGEFTGVGGKARAYIAAVQK